MIPQFNIRKGSAGGAGGFDSIDTITSTPIEVSDFPPANPSMDGDELGYDLSRAGEGLFIRNYFAKFTDPHFHKEKELVTATCTFEDHRRRATADGRVLQKKMILATGASNGVVKLWNILKGKFVKDLIFHSAKIKSIAYFDMPGGNTRIITGSEDKTVAIWDFNSGTVFKHFTRNDAIHCLAVCQKTGILVVGTADRKIAVYDIKSERVADIVNVADFETIHTDLILSLAILASDDKKESIRIVSVGWDKRMVVWDCFGKNIDQFEKGHTKSITALVAHTPSGEESSGVDLAPILITGSLDKTVIVWDFGTLKKIRVLEGHKGQVTAVKVSDRDDDGSPPIVITASLDKMLILWDLLSGYRVRTIEYSEPLNTLAIIDSIDGIIAISSGNSPFLLTWDLRRTHRTRKFVTGAVTAIDVYTPPNNGTPQVIIGAVDRKFTVFDYNDSKNYLTQHDYHTKRINAGVIYTPLTNVPNPGLPPTPLVVSADGNADIKVWTLDVANGPVVKKNLSGHKFVVLTVAVYDPTLYGRVRETSFERDRLSDATVKVDLRVPCVLSGGADKTIKVWDFLGVLGKGDLIAEISAAHNANVRSIVVHHPMNPAEKPSFISGSYDLTTTLWDLETLTKIRVFRGIHTDYVFFTALYDPRTQYIPTGDLPAHKQNPAVITSSYDFSFAVWDMHTGALRYHKTEAHRDSVTALAVYTPPFASSDDPLVITGSIDRMIHIWNLFTGEKVQTLVGHADRVCYIKVYEPPGQHPVILSGGDDEQTIVWEDSLYQKPFMPLRESVIRAFEADFEKIDWPMITEMAEIYGGELFVENSNLFTIAVLKDRADFLLKFWEYLTLTLPTIKPEEIESGSGVFFDILSIAIKRCDLTSVRAIVLSWIKNLNQDMDNMLTQRVYHPSYFFPGDVLELLYKYYPSEFLHFINSLKLIRNFQGLMGGKQRKYLSSSSRYEFQGSASRVDTYQDIWENFDPTSTYSPGKGFAEKQNWFDRALIQLDRQIIQAYQSFSRFFEVKIEPQPVTSMMVPFKDCNNAYRYLKKFVDVSNQLDDVSIFDSEIGIVFLRYFWHIRGRGTHMLAFFKYILFSIIFLVVIYSYEENYHRYPAISALSGICIGGFAWYGYEEFSQMRKMLGAFTVHNLITHIADLWNAVDLVIVVNGIVGLVLRLAYDRDTPTGRSCLAVTSVFMWFKILYFLRPFSSTGPLVAMILQIASEIRTFLFVLFCVLAGYAQAFWLLSNNDETLVFGTVSNAFLNAFLYMLGQNVSAEFSGTASPYVAQVFLIFFLITMMILMLNLLIALMGDVFSKVRSEGVALWRKEQAAIILEESFLYMNDTSIPKHLLVLKYTSEVTKSTMNYEEELENLIATSDVPKFTPFSLKGAKTVEDDEDGEDGSKADPKK